MPYQLKAPLSSTRSVNLDDVFIVKKALHAGSFYDWPKYGISPYPDQSLFQAIKKFQRKNDLEIDGLMFPGGETETAMADLIDRSPRYRGTNCGAFHGGVFSTKLCADCYGKLNS